MIELDVDVAIVGAGFGGSLFALILERIGLRSALIERGSHPRFALGESSTPLADLVLEELANRYDLPRLVPLANYGAWQRAYPELVCGLKRGFSYFHHERGRHFLPRPDHANELLVAASASAEDSDTHWFRSQFDQFLAREAQAAGGAYLDRTSLDKVIREDALSSGRRWTLEGRQGDEVCRVSADFLVDASGEAGFLARALGVPLHAQGMRTNSRCLFGHFLKVRRWTDILSAGGGHVEDHPFCCDDAALHHIFDGGWMYVLRFNNGVTSAGFMLDNARSPVDPAVSPGDEWARLMSLYPSIGEQFRDAELVDPPGGLRRTRRIQRRVGRIVGPDWAMLPLAAYSLDALHSTGNAHTLAGIARLADIFETSWRRPDFADKLATYEQAAQSEISLLDQLVHGCYSGFEQFELVISFAMFYFAAATWSETARRQGNTVRQEAFLLASDPIFRGSLDRMYRRLLAASPVERGNPRFQDELASEVASLIVPFNVAGLCDPARRNMYPFAG